MNALASLPPVVKLLIPTAVTLWLVAVAVMDHRTGRIPNAWTAPVMLGVGAIRVVQGFTGEPWRPVLMLVAWVIIFVLWGLHFIGGGDAKFLMAQFALFPYMEFVAVLALVLLVITVPLLLTELWRHRGAAGVASLRDRLAMGQLMPTEQELQRRGRRYAWTFAVPGIIYAWFYWGEFGPWF